MLTRLDKLQKMFLKRFGDEFRTVGEYYAAHSDKVMFEDSPWLPELAEGLVVDTDTEDANA